MEAENTYQSSARKELAEINLMRLSLNKCKQKYNETLKTIGH